MRLENPSRILNKSLRHTHIYIYIYRLRRSKAPHMAENFFNSKFDIAWKSSKKKEMLTLYLARRSMKALCLAKLAEPELFLAVALAAVDAAAVDDAVVPAPVVVAPAAVLFKPRFFNEPIEPFNKSGLSTSGPPNSCNCWSQQQSIASMPSSTYEYIYYLLGSSIW